MTKLNMITNVTPELLAQTGSRRDLIRGAGQWSRGVAVASLPFAFAALAKRAFAQEGQPSVFDVLNFALTLEELEYEFYDIGMSTAGLIPSADRQIFSQIESHEDEHRKFLREAIAANGGTPAEKPTFDFTAGGTFDTYENYETFKALAQAFEDTGVRAYKGGAPLLMGEDNIPFLEAALSIHSVEARHASMVRRLRGDFSEQSPNKGWITGSENDLPEQAQAVYGPGDPPEQFPAESNTEQGGVDLAGISDTPESAASEAFDEPLDMGTVLAIADLFIVS